jgi:hypothetical protein
MVSHNVYHNSHALRKLGLGFSDQFSSRLTVQVSAEFAVFSLSLCHQRRASIVTKRQQSRRSRALIISPRLDAHKRTIMRQYCAPVFRCAPLFVASLSLLASSFALDFPVTFHSIRSSIYARLAIRACLSTGNVTLATRIAASRPFEFSLAFYKIFRFRPSTSQTIDPRVHTGASAIPLLLMYHRYLCTRKSNLESCLLCCKSRRPSFFHSYWWH